MGVNESVSQSVPVLFSTAAQVPYSTKGADNNVINRSNNGQTAHLNLNCTHHSARTDHSHHHIITSSSSHLQSTCECVIPYHLSIAIAPVGIECKCLYVLTGPAL